MVTFSFSDLVLYFWMYSVLGWFCETVYCSVPAKKLVSRGFLHGPYCPIYGFGALLVLLFLEPLQPYPAGVFCCAVILTSALEYVTSWLMEKLFSIRWWDYSGRKYNLNGRVCLLNSLLFGIMGLGLVYLIHPPIYRLVARIPDPYERVIGSVLVALLLLDMLVTLATLAGLEEKVKRLHTVLAEMKSAGKITSWFDEHDLPGSLDRLWELQGKPELPGPMLEQLASIGRVRGSLRRLMRSFPGMRHIRRNEALQTLRSGIEASRVRRWEQRESLHRRFVAFTKRIGLESTPVKEESFARGVSFYKLCWVFFLSGVIGFVLETLFCLVMNGAIESRQGMLYGPFNQVYGFGAVVMVLLLHRLEGLKDRWIFLASALIGGGFEYVCSLLQETVFGTVSWEYSEQQFHVGGRTSLTYMFFWGILGVVLIKSLYPRMSRLIERIPNRQGVFFTWVLVVALSADLVLSALAVDRWVKRDAGLPPQNAVEEYMDNQYPDALMEEIYPNMQIVRPSQTFSTA